jgi:hypothetical protein
MLVPVPHAVDQPVELRAALGVVERGRRDAHNGSPV